MKVRLTRAARRDLEAIWTWSAEQWGEAHADAYIDRLVLRMTWLTKNPGLWRQRPEIAEGVYSFTETSLLIWFCAVDDALGILRVLHGRMEPRGRME
jgi:toxin ParE1/3/4